MAFQITLSRQENRMRTSCSRNSSALLRFILFYGRSELQPGSVQPKWYWPIQAQVPGKQWDKSTAHLPWVADSHLALPVPAIHQHPSPQSPHCNVQVSSTFSTNFYHFFPLSSFLTTMRLTGLENLSWSLPFDQLSFLWFTSSPGCQIATCTEPN